MNLILFQAGKDEVWPLSPPKNIEDNDSKPRNRFPTLIPKKIDSMISGKLFLPRNHGELQVQALSALSGRVSPIDLKSLKLEAVGVDTSLKLKQHVYIQQYNIYTYIIHVAYIS